MRSSYERGFVPDNILLMDSFSAAYSVGSERWNARKNTSSGLNILNAMTSRDVGFNGFFELNQNMSGSKERLYFYYEI